MNLWWIRRKHHWEGLYRNLPKNQRSTTTLQGKERAGSQHHQTREGGHQNPQGRLLSDSAHSGQRGSLGSHGQKSIYWKMYGFTKWHQDL